MKYKFEPKTGIEIGEIDKKLSCGRKFIDECEAQYEARVDNVADMIVKSACRAVMVSGPSASGKTTSANKLACALRRRGFQAAVVSLDDFFKNLEDYPLDEKGNPDLENVDAVDIQCVNDTLKQLFSAGRCTLPQFDFHTQHRKSEGVELVLDRSGYVIIEGIHALNPRLSESLPNESVFRLYVGLRTEYSQNGVRVLKTRDLRITRRMVRDYKFRGRDVAATLEAWENISRGEDRWIKPFKPIVDMLLDTSFPYEPSVFLPILRDLEADLGQGREHRDTLIRLCGLFALFEPTDPDCVPSDSMLREFLGDSESN